MSRVKLEVEYLWEQNLTLTQSLAWCDSVRNLQMDVINTLSDMMDTSEKQNMNLQSQILHERAKTELGQYQVKRHKRLKWVFVGTTVVTTTLLTLSLLK